MAKRIMMSDFEYEDGRFHAEQLLEVRAMAGIAADG